MRIVNCRQLGEGTGADAIDADIVARPIGSQMSSQMHQTAFQPVIIWRAVDAQAGIGIGVAGDHAVHAADIDDRAADAAPAQVQGDIARQQEVGGHADMIGLIEIIGGGAVDIGWWTAIGVVDQNVDRAHALDDGSHEVGDAIGIALRECQSEMPGARQARRECLCRIGVTAGDDQTSARFCQRPAHRRAQPTGRASHDSDFSLSSPACCEHCALNLAWILLRLW